MEAVKKKIILVFKVLFYMVALFVAVAIFLPTTSSTTGEYSMYDRCLDYSKQYREYQTDMFAHYKYSGKERGDYYKKKMNEVYDLHKVECDTTGYYIGDYPGED